MHAPAARRGLPPWLKTRLPSGDAFGRVRAALSAGGLNTVCEGARCPNMAECWGRGTATFSILGEACTRACGFCAVPALGRRGPAGQAPPADEPARLAGAVATLGLRHAVVTTVCRDDLPDQGASHVAACVREVRRRCPDAAVEVLLQDFGGDRRLLAEVAASGAHVLGHNLETVERLTPAVRDRRASYRLSLDVLRALKDLRPDARTKTSLMLGLGETEAEVMAACEDARRAGVDVLTLGQYLRPAPGRRHLPVDRYLTPEEFERLGRAASALGFLHVASSPFTRSSYRAEEALRP